MDLHPRCGLEPVRFDVDSAVLDDLRGRIRRTRWPQRSSSSSWSDGADQAYLRSVAHEWSETFDWRATERRLNGYANFVAAVEDVRLHYVHHRSGDPTALPLLLLHGWPSSFLEYLPTMDALVALAGGGRRRPIDVVVLSLPGYGLSTRPERPITYEVVAHWAHTLMASLGYASFGVAGDDFGAGVATLMALQHPERVVGLHLTHLELRPPLGPGQPDLSDEERAYDTAMRSWGADDHGFAGMQATRPGTVAVAMSDSPMGMAAWILDKWHAWTDHQGDLDAHVGRDFLLDTLTLYWVTQTFETSILDYLDNARARAALQPGDHVEVPAGIILFPHYGDRPAPVPPRSWAERVYDVRRWRVMPRGGHFAPIEAADVVAAEMIEFFDRVHGPA